jgi:Kef-type K+ transport system membrane component KefB
VIPLLLLLALGGLMQAARSFGVTSIAGTELAFGYLLLTAYFTAKVTSRIGLPKLTGYMFAGIMTGPYLLGLVDTHLTTRLALVKGTAVCMIGLTAGAGLVWRRVRPQVRAIARVSLLAVVGTALACATAVMVMRPWLPFLAELDTAAAIAMAFVIGATMSAKSPAVMLALTNETGAEGQLTDFMLATVVIGDLVTIILFAGAAAVASAVTGGNLDIVGTLVSLGWGIGGSTIVGGLLGAVIGVYLRKVEGNQALFATLICVVVAQIAPVLAIDPLITMIAAGVVLANVTRAGASTLMASFDYASLPVYLVFFAVAGAEVHLTEVVTLIVPVVLLAAVRAAGFFVFARAAVTGHRSSAVRRYSWYALLPQAGLALALAVLLTDSLGALGASAAGLVFGLVAFNEAVAPVILRVVMLRAGEAGRRTPTSGGGH